MRHSCAAEILSPGSERADRFTKRRLYQSAAVPLYWVIDADSATVEIWTPPDQFPHMERDRLVWSPPTAARVFEITLRQLLRPI